MNEKKRGVDENKDEETDDFGRIKRQRKSSPTPSSSSSSSSTSSSHRKELDKFRIEEKLEFFELKSGVHENIADYDLNNSDLKFLPVDDPCRMKNSGIVESDLVEKLWEQKDRMDLMFDSNKSNFYYQARDEIFPQDTKGSSTFWNRAGDKLNEVVQESNLFESIEEFAFIDACGAPGSFSQLLLNSTSTKPKLKCLHGFGMSIRDPNIPDSEQWYEKLTSRPDFTATYGEDDGKGTGDIYVPEYLIYLQNLVIKKSLESKLLIFVADGGFEIAKKNGKHMENYQELFSGRILLGEVLSMMMTLQTNGHFVCKLFDTFSEITVSLLYVITKIFRNCYIVKPRRSRIVNSERYVVGKFLNRDSNDFKVLLHMLTEIHKEFKNQNPDDPHLLSVRSVVPTSFFTQDEEFMKTLREMVESLCVKQTAALKKVLDKAERLMVQGNSSEQRKSYPPDQHSHSYSSFRHNNNSFRHNNSFREHNNSYRQHSHPYREHNHSNRESSNRNVFERLKKK